MSRGEPAIEGPPLQCFHDILPCEAAAHDDLEKLARAEIKTVITPLGQRPEFVATAMPRCVQDIGTAPIDPAQSSQEGTDESVNRKCRGMCPDSTVVFGSRQRAAVGTGAWWPYDQPSSKRICRRNQGRPFPSNPSSEETRQLIGTAAYPSLEPPWRQKSILAKPVNRLGGSFAL